MGDSWSDFYILRTGGWYHADIPNSRPNPSFYRKGGSLVPLGGSRVQRDGHVVRCRHALGPGRGGCRVDCVFLDSYSPRALVCRKADTLWSLSNDSRRLEIRASLADGSLYLVCNHPTNSCPVCGGERVRGPNQDCCNLHALFDAVPGFGCSSSRWRGAPLSFR